MDYTGESYNISSKIRKLINTIFFVRNFIILRLSDCKIIFLRLNSNDFRSKEIINEIESRYSIKYLNVVSIKESIFNIFNCKILYAPFSYCNPITNTCKLNLGPLSIGALNLSQRIVDRNIYLFSELSRLFKGSGIKFLAAMDDTTYTYPYVLAAKSHGIHTIAFQHGVYSDLNAAQVMENVKNFDWFDSFIVWGEYWKKLLIRTNKNILEEQIYVGKNKTTPITIKNYHELSNNSSKHISIPFKIWIDLFEPLLPHLMKELDIPAHMILSKNMNTRVVPILKTLDDIYPSYTGNEIGDGVATMKSLKSYEKFLNPDRVRETILCNNNHSSILADKHLIRIIMDYALQHWE